MTDASVPICFRRGRLYIARDAYDRHFSGTSTVVLLRRDSDLLVLPVRHAAAGGYVLKVRNAAGDRVVDGADYFRDQGCGDHAEWQGLCFWCENHGALRLYEFFLM